MHPHIPRPRRKATRTCTDTAGVVRTVHGEFMWPFTARVNEKTAPIERIAAVAICRRLRDARGRIYAPPSTANALLAGIAADDGTDCHSKSGRRMSALGHKRTKRHLGAMSALPPKADIERHDGPVRFVPIGDLSRRSNVSCPKSRATGDHSSLLRSLRE